ncbi:MAG: GTP-binding protein LepA [Parcubacteria group bacterium Gr01-1014_3]|nr:MAG: GTP-binding protein LepA [Parcubacteria group bacterium Gr01-1014_3]
MNQLTSHIRNFCIIAHIDHGKSTLADRLLESTGTIEKRLMKPQFLDQLELERERGITIKMAPVRMSYTLNAIPYVLNLIDTPGHSDFGYEVSRALAAVEGAVLLVDATQGIQAQTLANFENARKSGLTIIGAVNKVDAADPDQIEAAINDLSLLLNLDPEEILKVSGKTGIGVETLLQKIVEKIPAPSEPQTIAGLSRALVFDSYYDEHKGVLAHIRVFNGSFNENDNIFLNATNTTAKAKEVGYFAPKPKPSKSIQSGEIGYIATGIKDSDKLKIGDTLLSSKQPLSAEVKKMALPGYREPKPVVFVSFYPEDTDQYDELKLALSKLRLTDASLKFEADMNEVLGRGFKGGFLGRLHFEITAERLAREFKIETVHSFPSVAYRVKEKGEWRVITNPKDFPNDAEAVEEPISKIEILTPTKYLGAILQLKEIFRFSEIETKNFGNNILISAKLPLADLISDLDDKLKSVSNGFASLSYELVGYALANVAKLEIHVAANAIPGLTRIIPKKEIEREGRMTVEKLKTLLQAQQFTQALQAVVGGKIVARETIPALKKDLGDFGKNGGDRTRKMKLWKKQQRGKERLKERGEGSQIKIPANIFKELLKK